VQARNTLPAGVLRPYSECQREGAFVAMDIDVLTSRTFLPPGAEAEGSFLTSSQKTHPSGDRRSPRVAVKANGRILFLSLGDVIAVRAEGNYVSLQRQSGSVMLRESISVLAEKLELYGFIRIHRSALVNSSYVEEIRPYSTGEYVLRVKGGKEYTVTRKYKNNIRALAEFWIGGNALSREPWR
jgi:DNA-binding LytR/AlgR family response regulator